MKQKRNVIIYLEDLVIVYEIREEVKLGSEDKIYVIFYGSGKQFGEDVIRRLVDILVLWVI